MMQFLKYVLATIVGLILFSFVGFLMLIGLGAAFSSSDTKTSVASNSVLKLDLDKPIEERSSNNPFGDFGPIRSTGDAIGLIELKQALKDAKEDKNIEGIYLKTETPAAGWASLEEIRNALIDFKASKKFVYAYAEGMSEKGYYLASVADKIYLAPTGELEWNGLEAELSFFKGTLDKLGLKPEIFRVGEFKSAVEPFIREDMSEPNRRQVTSFLNSINDHMLVRVAQSRSLRVDSLKRYADNLTIQTAQDALRTKLITNVGYQDELEAVIRKQLGVDEKKKINYVSLSKYEDSEKTGSDSEGSGSNRIAVIVASGDIHSGKSSDNTIGSETIVEELRKARQDDKVKAIVLRVNSGGGSALASDMMYREVELAKKAKPVIGSMSDYAASGGYYMLMGCNKIVAEPNTITGSIGVFSLLFNTENFFKDKLGITYDRVKTNTNADFPTATHEMTPFQKQAMQRATERIYGEFTGKAAAGRKLPVDSIRAIAGGRVWTGTQGKSIGLVDQLGGLDDAIKLAAQSAKLKEGDYRLKYQPRKKEFFEQLMSSLSGDEETKVQAQLGELAPYVAYLKKLKMMQGIQMRLPFEIDIR
ncbi:MULTISPECIES: signal peptide peptidase SppA [unclassified Spirosoma]|uniref:signal peptide peptidase SppA n=1 Tax=unclassified Spirosoma TaxID=2621999 RepID=UPI000969A91E|nr:MULTISPECIES: signal peptide peptidase SppA [unclassified Spirosoma]MBN8821417.1 signal peptide peptidase SppA [Spirosoma sp.]OJW78202.1 MAG: signal peptide peptidase SppA [Spirosoma sp. 48-14]